MTAQDTTLPQLNGRHKHTYEAIFRHPTSHNLEWHDVRSLLAAIGQVSEGADGSLHISANGQSLTLHAPKHKDVPDFEEVLAIRHFLERSAKSPTAEPQVAGTHLLVLIDHHEAKIYRAQVHGAVPQQIIPYDPHGFLRHLHSDNGDVGDGKRHPERKSFYEGIAATLRGAEQILIFGSGTGESSAMVQLVADLKKHHANVAKLIVGAVVVDTHHQTEEQLLAKAREFWASEKL